MTLPVVTLHRGRARPFWFGNPVVFSGAVASVAGEPAPGDLVALCDADARVIGHGFWNPDSQYRVRVVRLERPGEPPPELAAILAKRLRAARDLRAALGLPSADTDAWRLFNSEGDGLSGLTVDVYADVAVVVASARWVEVHREAVSAAVRDVLGPGTRMLHRIPGGIRQAEHLAQPPPGEDPGPIEIREAGLRYRVEVAHGQKTGFYLDQRENRAAVRRMAAGRRVLDAFCFTGGFALAAAAGGASEVVAVDSSGPAIRAAREHAEANGLRIDAREGDAFDALNADVARWDLVVVDPPKLAAGRADLGAALARYRRINRAAVAAVAPGGVLVSCSCSSAVRRDDLLEVLRDAATEAARRLTVLEVRGAGPDHPVHPAWPEGEYLKCVIAAVG
jgi:23S rRNA G2069 N7-methylase RlmK/C1962 C5-methylase RlmI